MKKTRLITTAMLTLALGAIAATNYVWINTTDGFSLGLSADKFNNIGYNAAEQTVELTTTENTYSFPRTSLKNVRFGEQTDVVTMVFDGDDVAITNPYAFDGVEITREGAHVTIVSSALVEIEYEVSGTSNDGQIKYYTTSSDCEGPKFTFNGLTLTNQSGAAFNSQSSKKIEIKNQNGSVNTLCDAAEYTATPEGEDEKGTIFCEGKIEFKGKGTLNVTGLYKHAIVSDKGITVSNGTVNVVSAANDGYHANDFFEITGGTATSKQTAGDGIDTGKGPITISGGKLNIDLASADTKAIKSDTDITISGGNVTLNIEGDQDKGIKSKTNINITGGTINATLSGNAVVVDNDPSYCSAIKCDGDMNVSGGDITINHSGKAGKGISVDGNLTTTGGNFDITVTGTCDLYQNTTGEYESYSSTCITVDGNTNLDNGIFNLLSTGDAGKCIKVDGELTMGTVEAGPTITARTQGNRFSESTNTNPSRPAPGGGPGGWPGGGWGDQSDYANPKVVKTQGNLTVNNGTYVLTGEKEGAESLESKAVLTINGGTLELTSADDAINAATNITVNGGNLFSYSTNNDAIDSNGTININGGVVVAIGYRSPECGFDCDSNRFTVTGGTFVGMGGDNSSPTSSACTQPVLNYSSTLAQNATFAIVDADGNLVVAFTNPVAFSGTSKKLITSPKLVKGSSYKLYTGGTVNGGESFHGLNATGTYTPGTQAKSFTVSSMLQTL